MQETKTPNVYEYPVDAVSSRITCESCLLKKE